jgi:hypothetical protein
VKVHKPRSLDSKIESAGDVNWLELDRSPHAIQFYSGDDFLLDSVSRFISTALEAGDSCFVLVSPEHLERLEERLKARKIDIKEAVKKRRYLAVDALQVLARLMVDDRLSKTRFDEFIREVLLPLKAAAESKRKRVAVCGEIVGLLWAEGKPKAAIDLERFWNELAERGSYCLRCFYPIASFSDPGLNELFLKLCAEHTHCIPRERRLRDIAARVEAIESAALSS